MNPNKAMMTHKIKAAREKREFIYKGTPIRLLIDSLTETYQASRNWDNIFKISKEKKLSTKNTNLAKLFFRNEGGIKT